MKVKVAQSCPTLCYPMVYTVQGILQARILEWVAIPLSRGSSQHRDQTQVYWIAGGLFTSWANREALDSILKSRHYFDNKSPSSQSYGFSSSHAWVWEKWKQKWLSRIRPFATPWTIQSMDVSAGP